MGVEQERGPRSVAGTEDPFLGAEWEIMTSVV